MFSGMTQFMLSLSDKFFIVHVYLIQILFFCGPKLDLRLYNIAIESSGRTDRYLVPLTYTPYLGSPVAIV
jgi:hypothetical protein